MQWSTLRVMDDTDYNPYGCLMQACTALVVIIAWVSSRRGTDL